MSAMELEIEIGSIIRIGGKRCRIVGRGASGNTIVLHALPEKKWRPATIEDARQFRECRVRDNDRQAWTYGSRLVASEENTRSYWVVNSQHTLISSWNQCEVEDDA